MKGMLDGGETDAKRPRQRKANGAIVGPGATQPAAGYGPQPALPGDVRGHPVQLWLRQEPHLRGALG